jgi:hypothetical protein
MRRTIPFVVAAVATIVVVLGVMVGVGIGDPTVSDGVMTGAEVHMLGQGSLEDEPCEEVSVDGVGAMPLEFEVAGPSHVLAYFTVTWEGLNLRELGVAHLELDGDGGGQADTWFRSTAPNFPEAGALMWTFPNVQPTEPGETHTVTVYAAIQTFPRSSGAPSDLSATMMNCALTVFVIPAA